MAVTKEQLEVMKKEITELTTKYNMRVPVRSFMNDQAYNWRYNGPPDYTIANLFYLKGSTMNHHEGSLEQICEDVVKTWEFERSHKVDVMEHKGTDHVNFRIGANGAKMFDSKEAHEVGNYNVLLEPAKKENWGDELRRDWEGSHHIFKDCFAAFPWEVLKAFSGPPKVSFTWRHWGHFTGKYQGNKGSGQVINITGFCTATVSPDLKLQVVEVWYDPDVFLMTLAGKSPPASSQHAHEFIGPYIPYVERRAKMSS